MNRENNIIVTNVNNLNKWFVVKNYKYGKFVQI